MKTARAPLFIGLLLTAALTASLGCNDNVTPYPTAAGYVAGQPLALECVPNLDGRIDAAELGAALGIPIRYRVSPDGVERNVDLTGIVDADGQRVWDWSEDRADDQLAEVAAAALKNQWFADRFSNGELVIPSDLGGSVMGIYRMDDQALWLQGLASAEEAPDEGQTLIVYDEPVAVFRFPLEVGRSWTSVGEFKQAQFLGLPWAGRDTYHVAVDAAGVLELPDLSFGQALRVKQTVTLEPAVGPTSTVLQTSFVFECFGEVARATSRLNEANQEFTIAAEVRRLGL